MATTISSPCSRQAAPLCEDAIPRTQGKAFVEDMERLLVPMMKKYNVTAYICGHEHHLEHIVPPGTNLNFLISGAGSEVTPSEPTTGTRFTSSTSGFMALAISPDSVLVQAIGSRGQLIYRASLKK